MPKVQPISAPVEPVDSDAREAAMAAALEDAPGAIEPEIAGTEPSEVPAWKRKVIGAWSHAVGASGLWLWTRGNPRRLARVPETRKRLALVEDSATELACLALGDGMPWRWAVAGAAAHMVGAMADEALDDGRAELRELPPPSSEASPRQEPTPTAAAADPLTAILEVSPRDRPEEDAQ